MRKKKLSTKGITYREPKIFDEACRRRTVNLFCLDKKQRDEFRSEILHGKTIRVGEY